MIALFFTLFITVYLLGPDLVSRFILGFVCPGKVLDQSRSEEFTRAAAWAILPLCFAVLWAWHDGTLALYAGVAELKLLFSFLYSPGTFPRAREDELRRALFGILKWNFCILERMYALVILFWIGIDFAIKYFGRIRRRAKTNRIVWTFRVLLELFILPRVAFWHLYLSRMLVEYKDMEVHADILTKNDVMYVGKLADKDLASDGELAAVTLENARRFRREHYMRDKDKDPTVKAEAYWVDVPGKTFIIPGSSISTINIRQSSSLSLNSDTELLKQVRTLLKIYQ